MTSHMYTYNADCKQPDPEIWGGGVAGGPLVFSSNVQDSFSRIYNNEITTPNSATGVISIYGAFIVKAPWIGSGSYSVSGSCVESISWDPQENLRLYENDISSLDITFDNDSLTFDINEPKPNIKINGSASNIFVSFNTPEDTTTILSSGTLIEKITHNYNETSETIFESESYGFVYDISSENVNYGLISDDSNEIVDNGLIIFAESTSPFGTVLVNGSAFVTRSDDIRTYNTGATYRVSYNPPEIVSTLFAFNGSSESISYDYNLGSSTIFSIENNGLIIDPVTEIDDYGFINGIPTAFENYDSIEFVSSQSPFGLFNVSGSAGLDYINTNIYGYVTGAEVKVVYSPDNTSGTLFGFGEKFESVTYDYSLDSTREFIIEDFESITSSPTSTDEFGFVTEIQTSFIDYGSVEESNEVLTPFGLFNISGSAEVEYTNINFYGYVTGAEVKVVYSPDDISGTLFNFGEKFESVTYDYSLGSILFVGDTDYGFVYDSTTSIEEYGSIFEIHSQTEDIGSILGFSTNQNIVPFGSLTILGGLSTEKHVESYFANVPLIVKTFTFLNDSIRQTGINTSSFVGVAISERGIGTNSTNGFNIPRHIKFGTVGASGSRRVDLLPLDLSEYGSITFSAIKGNSFNGGEEPDSGENLILRYSINGGASFTTIGIIVAENNATFNTLNTATLNLPLASRTPSTILRIEQQNSNGSVFDHYAISQISVNPVSELISPRILTFSSGYSNLKYISSSDSTQLFTISSGSDERNATSYVASGSLFEIGDVVESVTYEYSESSVLVYNIDDYQSITDSVTSSIDYGFVYETITGEDDYELITDTLLSGTPFGGMSLTGSAVSEWIDTNFHGLPEAQVKVVYSPDDTSGTLFGFGEKIESVTYDYNEASSLVVEEVDNGLITSVATISEDYGRIDQVYSGEDDFGIIDQTTSFAFGFLSLTGSAGVNFVDNNLYLGAIESVTYSPDNTSGTLFGFGEKTESITYDYNLDSILLVGENNYGFIYDPISSTEDYGFVYDPYTQAEDLLTILDFAAPVDVTPFGSSIISGVSTTRLVPSYTTGGSITITGSAVESKTDDFGSDRRRGGNINLCGDATYSETDVYVGIGTLRLDAEGISTPALIRRVISYLGLGTIFVSDSVTERDLESYVGLGTIFVSGTGLESESEVYTGLGTIFVSDFGIESESESYVGLGTIFVSGTAIESFTGDTPDQTQLFLFSGTAIESFTGDTPDNTQLFTISGELNHPNIDYTPHYGIEKNIGIGTTGVQISGTAFESESEVYIGLGTFSIVNGLSPLESYPWLPEPGIGRSWSFSKGNYTGLGSITISTGIAQTHYYSPIYPRNALGTDPSSGIGTIRIYDDKELTFYRATLPIFADGTIYIVGVGSEGQFNVGAKESFTPATEIGTGLFTISGIASTRQIDVFGDYITSGVITISSETAPIVEKYTASWVGLGTIFVSDTIIERNTESYFGSGTILALSGDSEAYSAQTPEDTATLQISGSAQESFVAQTPEDTILYQFSGAATDEKLIKVYEGFGSTILSGSANVTSSPAYPASGTIRFENTRHVDNLYDTCDSIDITSDEQDSAYVTFTANPPEDTILFVIGGNALTSETALYTEFVSGLYTLYGTYQNLKLTHSESGIGTIFITETSSDSERDVYVGSGSLFAISGATEFYSAQTPESTVILQISGSAITSTEAEYSIVGIGLFALNGVANTQKITSYTPTTSGTIVLSGELNYPDIIFIPSPDGSGTINVLGSSDNSLTKVYEDTSGVLFTFSSGLESFTKSTYSGLGTVYIEEISGTTIDNPYQIPRTYVCII